jgi:hypothetical protein
MRLERPFLPTRKPKAPKLDWDEMIRQREERKRTRGKKSVR